MLDTYSHPLDFTQRSPESNQKLDGRSRDPIEKTSSLIPCYIKVDATPIACLATELLVLIFEHGHDGCFTSFSHLVSSVCRYWRAVALDTPSIWSPIVFDEGGNPHYLDLARLYLKRSKTYPMEFVVRYDMDEFIKSLRDDLIIPHLHHCRALSIDGGGEHLLADILHLGSIATPILERLELTTHWPVFDATGLDAWLRPPQRVLFDTPSLRILRLDTLPFHSNDPARSFRLGNLTSFWFKWDPEEPCTMTHDQVSQVIEAMPKLRELTLCCNRSGDEYSPLSILDKLPPTLNFLELNGVPVAWDIKYGNWSGRDFSALHTLRLAFTSPEKPVDTDLFTLLELTPHLRDLYVGVIDLLPHPSKLVTAVRLHHLAHLTLDYCGQRTIQAFLNNITAPALIKGIFIVPHQFDDGPGFNQPDPVIPTFWLSCPLVEQITLSHGCTLARSTDLIAALHILKHVKSLDLRGRSKWDDELLRGLGTPPWSCPSLESVSFSHLANFSQDALESFVLARQRGFMAGQCAAIKMVGMRGCNELKNTETLEGVVREVWHWI
jgi:hypothetical protein